MRTLLQLLLLALIIYFLVTSDVLSDVVSQVSIPTGPTSTISVNVVVPLIESTSTRPPQVQFATAGASATATPIQNDNAVSTVPAPSATPLPPPTFVFPQTPPTLAVETTPTPASDFPLMIESPLDGQTLRFSPALVSGTTQADAIVSVNDAVGFADAQGRFNIFIDVEEGPNVLEVLASNAAGEQVFVILTVLYDPDS